MSNPSKAKGTAAETAVLRYMREHGFPWAERLALAGINDCGDISLLPGRAAILEVKSYRGAPGVGQPAPAQLEKWLCELDREIDNAGADTGALVVKRTGTTDVGAFWAYMRLGAFLRLLGAPNGPADDSGPICASVASLSAILRARGYGTPHETDAACSAST